MLLRAKHAGVFSAPAALGDLLASCPAAAASPRVAPASPSCPPPSAVCGRRAQGGLGRTRRGRPRKSPARPPSPP
eukprot:4839199-Alexandrium_andersonii.AAC.1